MDKSTKVYQLVWNCPKLAGSVTETQYMDTMYESAEFAISVADDLNRSHAATGNYITIRELTVKKY